MEWGVEENLFNWSKYKIALLILMNLCLYKTIRYIDFFCIVSKSFSSTLYIFKILVQKYA